MSLPRVSSRFSLAILALSCLVTIDTHAICTVLNSPKRFVGNHVQGTQGYDANCTDDDIQSAIGAIKDGANTCPATIYITREHTWTSQHLVFDNTNRIITLVGLGDGVPCGSTNLQICDPMLGCPPPPTDPLGTIDGSGTYGSVIHLNGTNTVTLDYLTITHGNVTPDQNGGGIFFSGSGSLTLETSTVAVNSAGYGAGIYFNGSGGGATLTLLANTLVLNNTAQISGGGIRIEGSTRLFILSDPTYLADNHALEGDGGAIAIVGPARADIGSPGYNSGGVISNNDAINGGGIAVTENGNGGAVLRMFAHDGLHPTVLEHNTASTNGGGIYVQGAADACLFASRIDHNVAEDGAAIYKKDTGGIYINSGFPARLGADCGPETVHDLGGVTDCFYDAHCNTFYENQTQHADGSPSAGSVIYHFDAELIGSRFRVQGNTANSAINATFGGTIVSRCLITDNNVSGALVRSNTWGGGTTLFRNCTFAHNVIDGSYVFEFHNQELVSLQNDIIAEPGHLSVDFSPQEVGATLDVGYTMSNDISTLPHSTNPSVVQDDPRFLDASIGDYHLRNDSPALDFAPGIFEQSLDYAYGSFDLPDVTNRFGPADLGPYELISTDRIFANGFGDVVPPLDCNEYCY